PLKAYTLHVVKYGKAVLESRVLPRGEKFTPTITLSELIKVESRDLDLRDVEDLMKINKKQLLDKDSKRGAAIILASAFLMLGFGIFSPKKEMMKEIPKVPVPA